MFVAYFRHYSGIHLEKINKRNLCCSFRALLVDCYASVNKKTFVQQSSWPQDEYSNSRPPEYAAGVLKSIIWSIK
jgi:hypothetical protein